MLELEDVVERVQRGDAKAFGDLVRQTQANLFRVAARMLGSRADAEDVLQEAYVKAYDALRSGRFASVPIERASGEASDRNTRVSTWLYRVVVNQAIDHLRGNKRRRAEPLDEAIPTKGDSAETHVALRELSDMLAVLPEPERVAFVLKDMEGHTSKEIAEMVGATEGAIEQRLVRARAALREAMGKPS